MPERVWKGAPALEAMLVPLRSVVLHPQNPRRGQVALIAESLERFGQVRAVLTDRRKTVIAGNHTAMAARQLGWTHIAVVRHEFTDEAEARAYLLADNRLADVGGYQQDQLAAMLAELEATDGWDGTGYSADDLEDLRAAQGNVQTTAHEDFQGGYALTAEELAARAARLQAGNPMNEIVLELTPEQSAQFESDVKVIRKELGFAGVTEAVVAAVSSQATRA